MMPFLSLYERMAFEGELMKPSKKVALYSSVAALAIGIATVATGDNPRPQKSYDNNNVLVYEQSIDEMLKVPYKLDASIAYVSTDGNLHARMQGHGTTFVGARRNGRQYFITANHVVSQPDELMSPMGIPVRVQNREYTIEVDGQTKHLDVVRRNSEHDVAILKSREDLGLDKLLDFADLPLKAGDQTYACGFPLDIGKYLVSGMIGRVEDNSVFLHSAAANPGYSGGPIYVLDGGRPRIAGVARFYFPQAQSIFGATRIDRVVPELEEVLKADRVYR